jgi:hypothetical protein
MHAAAQKSTRWLAAVEEDRRGSVFCRAVSGRERRRRSFRARASSAQAANVTAHAVHPARGARELRG